MGFDRKGREKKGWKAFQADYDYVFSLSDRTCSYCLTDQQVAALLSMTEYLKWPTRWVSDDDEIDKDLIDLFTDGLERNLMSGCCDDNLPIQYRYSDDGILQRSLNGGGTWIDAPEYDPRNYSPQFPKPPGEPSDDKKCIAATGAALLVKEQVGNQLTEDMGRYTLGELITDWISVWLQTTDLLRMLLTVVANQIFALGVALLIPALTDEVYDTFQCILYCNMSDDISFSNASAETVRSEVVEQIPGIAGLFLQHLVYLLSGVGLTNLVRSGAATEGDCSECACSDEVRVYWRNGGMGYPAVEIFPDEEGVYTATCDVFDVNGYYGVVQFGPDGEASGYTPCHNWSIISDSGAVAAYSWDCVTGEPNELSNCWFGRQRYQNAPWTLTFVVLECP